RPLSATGIAFCWISVGSVYWASRIAFRSGSQRPIVSNSFTGFLSGAPPRSLLAARAFEIRLPLRRLCQAAMIAGIAGGLQDGDGPRMLRVQRVQSPRALQTRPLLALELALPVRQAHLRTA